MPLLLPQLDNRRFDDLVGEGRALIPRYAPEWTDHNAHDPGITIMELLAWLVEQEIYRANRVPDAHRRKFLKLLGFSAGPAHPALLVLALRARAGEVIPPLPCGTTFAADPGGVPFRTLAGLHVADVSLAGIQVFDGAEFTDRTRQHADGLVFPALGERPEVIDGAHPALYLQFDQPLPVGQPVALWLALGNFERDWRERLRILEEQAFCAPPPRQECLPDGTLVTLPAEPPPDTLPEHHSVRTAWEYFDGTEWQALDKNSGQVDDQTFGLSLSGLVTVTLPAAMQPVEIGAIPGAAVYLRCRLLTGSPDALPLLYGVWLNAALARQTRPHRALWTIAPGAAPADSPTVGQRQTLRFSTGLHEDRLALTSLEVGGDSGIPDVLVLAHTPATATDPGSILLDIAALGTSSGYPEQAFQLERPFITGGAVRVWTLEADGFHEWAQQPDLDASQRVDRHFALDADSGLLRFGDGEHGRVPPRGALVMARYDSTQGSAGNLGEGRVWKLDGADDEVNAALLPAAPATIAAQLDAIEQVTPGILGAAPETLSQAIGRAAQALWAHERLVDFCEQADCDTLDQQDRGRVLDLTRPARAVTVLDYERLALDVPGTRVGRARVVPGVHPQYPALSAPGTVSVIVLPEYPPDRPVPTRGLLETVRRSLHRRRVIGTRLVVTGPEYIEVRVVATVRAKSTAFSERIQRDIVLAIDDFLHPLHGGPAGAGYPFGRDVYRAEILQVIDNVSGVDHVLALELFADGNPEGCSNICVHPLALAVPGEHAIEIR